MLYVDFSAGNKDYKLKLSISSIIALEKKIGKNPIAVFGLDAENPEIPTITDMVNILWASLQEYQHGVSIADAQGIFQEWVNDGNLPTAFVKVITDVYRVSGLFKQNSESDEETEEKN